MGEIVEGLGAQQRERVAALLEARTFFWIDLDTSEADAATLGDVFGISEDACRPLLDFDPNRAPSRKFRVAQEEVVFSFTAFVDSEVWGPSPTEPMRPLEVHVLVCGEFLLTLHEDPGSLHKYLDTQMPEHRSEQYLVYVVLDAMIATAFDALNEVELTLEQVQEAATAMTEGRVKLETLRSASRQLSAMRRRIGPQRGIFERISEEIGRVQGLSDDHESYFERIFDQLNRLVDGIDAVSTSMAELIDLRLNETMYTLTVVATIFLPLTFITGFFGMNLEWMIERIDTFAAFLILGIATPVLLALATWVAVQRRSSPVQVERRSRRAARQDPTA